MGLDGMDVSFCGTDRSLVGPFCQSFCWRIFYQVARQNARSYFLTSCVCLQARDCIGKTWSHEPMDNLEMSQQITYRRYVLQGTAEEVWLL